MDAGVLYSGGAGSTLAALVLGSVAEVTLPGCTFGVAEFDYAQSRVTGRSGGHDSRAGKQQARQGTVRRSEGDVVCFSPRTVEGRQ